MDKPDTEKAAQTEARGRKIRQGMPSYSEPNPEIAGVVGKVARGRPVKGPSTADEPAPETKPPGPSS